MTTYNAGVHLDGQLETVLDQVRPADEVVVTDDCSTDGTWGRLQAFARTAPVPISLHRNDRNVGLRRNIESTLRRCRGDVVVLADQDDEWDSLKLAHVAAAFGSGDVALWFSDAELIGDDGRDLGPTVWQAVDLDGATRRALGAGGGVERLLHGQTVTGATMAVRRTVLDHALPLPAELDGPAHLYLHDGWLAVVARTLGAVVAEPRCLTRYRQHPGQTTAMSMTAPVDGPRSPTRPPSGSGSAQLQVELQRTRLVADRVLAAGIESPQGVEVLRRASLLSARARARGGRPGGAFARWVAGDYHRLGYGTRLAAKDVLVGAHARAAGARTRPGPDSRDRGDRLS